jgi:hypothetical protein
MKEKKKKEKSPKMKYRIGISTNPRLLHSMDRYVRKFKTFFRLGLQELQGNVKGFLAAAELLKLSRGVRDQTINLCDTRHVKKSRVVEDLPP